MNLLNQLSSLAALLMLAATADAQYAVRLYSQLPATNQLRVLGIPTNWPAEVRITTNRPAGFLIMTEGQLDNLKATNWTAYTNWRATVLIPWETTQRSIEESNRVAAASANIVALRNLFDDFLSYEQAWQAGTNYTSAQLQVILRKHNGAFLRLKPILQELYQSRPE